jgi:alpha-D-ribose 1-methylphosphonate 5-triphosphate synthase subunit PhnH
MTGAVPSAFLPGFADPVHDAQRCFRAVLEALSRPGKPATLGVLPPPPSVQDAMPAACLSGMIAIALTLCDADTPVWLDARLDTPAMRQHLRFHCGCPVAPDPGLADFAFIGDAKAMPRFACFSSGDPGYPDRSATLIIAADLSMTAPDYLISGPGVSRALHPRGLPFAPAGLPAWFWEDRAMNRSGHPAGVDVLFVESRRSDGDSVRIAGLPRTASALPAKGRAAPGRVREDNPCMSR